jgi:hypothetical protein
VSLPARFLRRLGDARPGLAEGVVGGFGWGLAMAAAAALGLEWRMEAITGHFRPLLAVYFAGGAVAWPAALFITRFVALGARPALRFAVALATLALATIGLTALVFAAVYRQFYADWHGEPFTTIWVLQFVVTIISALYQFAVLGLWLFLPLGPVLGAGGALGLAWLAGRPAALSFRGGSAKAPPTPPVENRSHR